MLASHFTCPISAVEQIQSCNPFPLSNSTNYKKLSTPYKAFETSITSYTEPKTYLQASLSPEWRVAMEADTTTLELNDNWVIVNLLSDKETIGCKWVSKIIFNADESIESYKVRIVESIHKTRGVGLS